MKIHVVCANVGAYSDSEWWPVVAYRTAELSEEHARLANEEVRAAIKLPYGGRADAVDNFKYASGAAYCDATYDVHEIELLEALP